MVRFFDKLRHNGQAEAAVQTGWDELADTEVEGRVAENPRQQRKIEYCLTTGNYRAIGESDVPAVDEDEFLQRLGTGEITDFDKHRLLTSIVDPVSKYGGQTVAEGIIGNKHEARILGHFSGVGFSNYTDVDGAAVESFVKRYPTPMEFDAVGEDFLEKIKEGNGEEKYREYQRDMVSFKSQIYGKRQEYWEQMKILEERAKEWTEGKMEAIDENEAAEILGKTTIDGDSYVDSRGEYELRAESLQEYGLAPKYKMKVEGVEIELSGAYKAGGHNAVMAYVKTEDGYKARSYYQSRSAGLWRYLPDYVGNKEESLEWYGKGISEESLTLPFVIQKQLEKVRQDGVMKMDRVPGEFFLAGTAKRYESKDEYREHLNARDLRGEVYREVESSAVRSFGVLSRNKGDPTRLDIDGGEAPDFSRKIDNFVIEAGNSGRNTAEIYESLDGKLNYMFLTDEQGRSYIGGIEAKSKITSCGVREKWVSGGDLVTPMYEYFSQASGFGDLTDTKGSYACMWTGYLSKMPIIRKYQAAKSRESW